MNKFLIISTICLSLLGCDISNNNGRTSEWDYKLILVKSFKYSKLYISEDNRCYHRSLKGSASLVICEDFGVDTSKYTKKSEKSFVSEYGDLLNYIRDYCVINDKYERFPRISGDSVVKELQGKELSCKLPDNIDTSLKERAEYLRLKNKYEGGKL